MNDKFNKIIDNIKIVLFISVLLIFFVIGLAFFARPTESENEKRKLTEFPSLNISDLLSGDFTSQVSL